MVCVKTDFFFSVEVEGGKVFFIFKGIFFSDFMCWVFNR